MKYFLTIIFCLSFINSKAQVTSDIVFERKNNNNIIDVDTLTGINNKKIIFKFDTLYIINEYGLSEFTRCAGELNRIKNYSGSLTEVSGNLFQIESGINDMDLNMKSMTDFIKKYEKETSIRLDSLSGDNYRLKQNMETLSKDLDEACDKLKAEKWNSLGTKAIYGLGGFLVGGLIISLLTK